MVSSYEVFQGILGSTIYSNCVTLLQKSKMFIHFTLGLGYEFGLQRIWDIFIMRPYSMSRTTYLLWLHQCTQVSIFIFSSQDCYIISGHRIVSFSEEMICLISSTLYIQPKVLCLCPYFFRSFYCSICLIYLVATRQYLFTLST